MSEWVSNIVYTPMAVRAEPEHSKSVAKYLRNSKLPNIVAIATEARYGPVVLRRQRRPVGIPRPLGAWLPARGKRLRVRTVGSDRMSKKVNRHLYRESLWEVAPRMAPRGRWQPLAE